MELWLLAERQDHLECLAECNDPEQREGHRIIAKWIKYFIGQAKDHLLATEAAVRNPEPPAETEYMDYDSEGGIPGGLDN